MGITRKDFFEKDLLIFPSVEEKMTSVVEKQQFIQQKEA